MMNLFKDKIFARHRTNDQAGFTLIEIILVMIFLSVALLATMNMISTSLSKSFDMDIISTANNLANEQMEKIFTDKKSKGYGYVVSENYPPETNAGGFQGFNRYVTIITYSTNKKIVVTVTHASIDDFILISYLTNY